MSKHIVFELHPDSLFATVCNRRGNQVSLESISQQSISDDADADARTIKQAVVQAASVLNAGKSEVTFVVARSMIEVRTVSVPRMDADELPDVIRFQAQRQLANMSDSWHLDYVMLPDEPGQEMMTALVSAMSPEKMAAIEAGCAQANMQLAHVAIAPIELARYALAAGKLGNSGGVGQASLVMCLSGQQADILVLKAGNVVLVRGTKLPSEPELLSRAIVGETRRSLMAAATQLGSESISEVLLVAASELATAAEQPLADALGVPVIVVDPVELLPEGLAGREQLATQHTNRIASVAGAALHATADRKSTIDLKNPKKRAPKKKNTTTWLLAAAAGLLLLLAGVSWWITTNRALDEELLVARDTIKSKKELVEASRDKISQLAEVETFLKGSPNYLDELSYISRKIPASEQVILGGPTFSTLPNGSGQIRMPIATDSASTISEFEESLRDGKHVVKGSDSRQSSRPTDLYKWEAVETITVAGAGWDLGDDFDRKPAPSSDKQDSDKESSEPDDSGKDGESAVSEPSEVAEADAVEPAAAEAESAEGVGETDPVKPAEKSPESPVPDETKQASLGL